MTIDAKALKFVSVHRRSAKEGVMALPGGLVMPDESLIDAARRELAEETSINVERDQLHQISAFGDPDRDPRGRYISVAFLALLPFLDHMQAGTDAAFAEFIPVHRVLNGRVKLEFDHNQIVEAAHKAAVRLIEDTPAATSFCARSGFSLTDLRRVYETILGWEIDPANFRRKVRETPGFVELVDSGSLPPTGGSRGRPSDMYRRGRAKQLDPPMRFRGPSDTSR